MTAEELEAGKDFGRYKDVDGDGIPWRTLPGTHPTKGAYFTRGTTRDAYARYSEAGPDYIYNVQRLLKKFDTAAKLVPQPVLRAAAQEDAPRRHLLRLHQPGDGRGARRAGRRRASTSTRCGCAPSRSRASVREFIAAHDQVFVVEQNRDAQMRTLLVNELEIDPARLIAGAALRRHADHRALHHRGDHQARARARQRRSRPRQARDGRDMTYLAKPRLHHPTLAKNKVGYTRRDYEGKISTLCAGCGHDSISAAIVQACWELDIEPHRVAKLSGIGCSSQDAGLLPRRRARLQHRARPHARAC